MSDRSNDPVDFDAAKQKSEIFEPLFEHFPPEEAAAFQAMDFQAERDAWVERTAAILRDNPIPDTIDHLQFVIVYIPIAGDEDGVYADIMVGASEDYDPLAEGDAFYEDYCPYPKLSKHHSPVLSTIGRAFEDLDVDDVGLPESFELEMMWAAGCVDALCRKYPDLIAAPLASRTVYIGWNENMSLLGVAKPGAWHLWDNESEPEDFLEAMS
ncbi:MAG: hypothetical protein RLY93_04465 [Sumerlaeia bacterium]